MDASESREIYRQSLRNLHPKGDDSNMAEYKPNSHKFKEEQKNATPEKRVGKVVQSDVKTRKKSEIRKFADVFISEDAANVKSYILMDVLVPAVKKAISDIVTSGIDMILYGGSGRGNRTNTRMDRVSYINYADRRPSNYASGSNRPRESFGYDDFVFATRPEAEDVLAQMDALIEQYKMVRVTDLYDMVGKTCDYTFERYGWTNLRTAEVKRVSDGYVIKLPRALPIDN